MIEPISFINQTPPESAFLMGLTTGALISKTVRAVLQSKIRGAAGVPENEQ